MIKSNTKFTHSFFNVVVTINTGIKQLIIKVLVYLAKFNLLTLVKLFSCIIKSCVNEIVYKFSPVLEIYNFFLLLITNFKRLETQLPEIKTDMCNMV